MPKKTVEIMNLALFPFGQVSLLYAAPPYLSHDLHYSFKYLAPIKSVLTTTLSLDVHHYFRGRIIQSVIQQGKKKRVKL